MDGKKRTLAVIGIVTLFVVALWMDLTAPPPTLPSPDPISEATSTPIADPRVATCLGETCLDIPQLTYPVGELDPGVVTSLDRALDDERRARATYEAVIDSFGAVRPFIMIIRSEEQHIAMLKAVYDKYGLEIPSDQWAGTVEAPDSFSEACEVGSVAERENVRLYREELLPAVAAHPDIESVFMNLAAASEERHLPAFLRCSGDLTE